MLEVVFQNSIYDFINSYIYPFQFESSYKTSNVIFYNCSSIGLKYLKNGDSSSPQDLHVCPIYVVGSTDNVAFCDKMFPLDSRLSQYDFQWNTFEFRWSPSKCDDVEKNRKNLFKFVLPASGSIVSVLCIVFLLLIYR